MKREWETKEEEDKIESVEAALAQWKDAEINVPVDLHQQIMQKLQIESQTQTRQNIISKRLRKRYYKIAMIAAVLLCAIGIGMHMVPKEDIVLQMSNVADSGATEKSKEESPAMYATAEKKEFAEASQIMASRNNCADMLKDADSLMDWELLEEETTKRLEQTKEALQKAQPEQKNDLQNEVDWLEECLKAIQEQDEEKYQVLQKQQP